MILLCTRYIDKSRRFNIVYLMCTRIAPNIKNMLDLYGHNSQSFIKSMAKGIFCTEYISIRTAA